MTPEEFKAARRALGWTQTQMATRLEVTANTIQRYEMAVEAKGSRRVNGPRAAQVRLLLRDLGAGIETQKESAT